MPSEGCGGQFHVFSLVSGGSPTIFDIPCLRQLCLLVHMMFSLVHLYLIFFLNKDTNLIGLGHTPQNNLILTV